MTPSRKPGAGLFVLAALMTGHAAGAEWRFPAVDRVVAVADIHGAYDAFERILTRAGVIDASMQWSGGDTHLVIVGDVLDRGAGSRRAMDLIMRLESEAAAAGGRVHLVLGNHELMNLTADLRYVAAGEYAAFEEEESPAVREAVYQRHVAATIGESVDGVRAELDQRYPPGFFAHRAAFAPDGLYGAWLLNRPLAVVIGDTAFVHGGLSGAVADLGLERVNTELIEAVGEYARVLGALVSAGVLAASDNFYDHPSILDDFSERVASGEARWPDGAEVLASRLRELNEGLAFTPSGPAWYRGTVACSPLIERDRLDTVLREAGVERVVIGHTPTPDSRVLSRLDGAVIRIDTGMLNEYYGGRAAAWMLEGSRVSVIYEDEENAAEPAVQARRVGVRPAGLTAEDLETFLLHADIAARGEGEEADRVTLTDGEIELEALFVPAARSGVRPDVAVYRLDRLLGLDMVPVTVAREVDGEPGSLQYAPARVITEPQRSEQGLGGAAWCPLADQFLAMYAFDSLIFNEGRTPDRIRYSLEDFQLILVGHERALGTRRGRPAHLEPVALELGPAWHEVLAALDEGVLTERLGDVLDRRRIRALLQRRDALVESSPLPEDAHPD